jgi:hypothetical protein
MTQHGTLDVAAAPARRFTARPLPQYSKRRVLGVWAAAALPMGVLSWAWHPCRPARSTARAPGPARSSSP